MHASVMIDGQLVAPEAALVSVFDRGFLYGDSVFESMRTYGGRLCAFELHLARLERSAARVLIPLPVPLSQIRGEVLEALHAHGARESYVRIMITRGSGRALGLDPGLSENPRRVVFVNLLEPPAAEVYERGIAAITYRAERPSDAASVADAKIGNYLLAVLAMHRARACGAGEALLETGAGEILEGCTSNVFVVRGNTLATAPESAPILAGITRARVLEIAEEARLPLELRLIARAELERADEIFITSSIREIVPVVVLDGKPVGFGFPGPVTRALLTKFRETIQSFGTSY
jgi:branched-chain amino acid aminotransferase